MGRGRAGRKSDGISAEGAGLAVATVTPEQHALGWMQDASRYTYRLGNDLDLDEVIGVYRRSTLGERRPVDDRERMAQMLRGANLVVTAWDGPKMVGIARSLSDFAHATYLADLAVDADYQRAGVGRALIQRTRLAGGRASVFLFAAPKAAAYYPHIGFSPGSGWILHETDEMTY
jgi:GNAT superfamily N-acetyltransferase